MSTDPSASSKILQETPAWRALLDNAKALSSTTLNELFAEDPDRGSRFTARSNSIYFDYSKDHLTDKTLELLVELAHTARLAPAIDSLFNGDSVNNTENRPALHTALRGSGDAKDDLEQVATQSSSQTLNRMCAFAEQVRQGELKGANGKPFLSIINLGIGGSDLGPRLVVTAFPELHHPKMETHFVASIDSHALSSTLEKCVADTTLFIVSSKSFTTLETLTNANIARDWLRCAGIADGDLDKHFVAATGNEAAAKNWGILGEHIFPVQDWVGGRFSLWSATGLPIVIALGPEVFRQLLAGANEMDEHFRNTTFDKNLPVLHGLQSIWHTNFRAYRSRAVLPYIHRLHYLPEYLQQLTMESLGKSTTKQDAKIDISTGQIIWGSEGTSGQHSFHQLLLQGTETLSIDFIASRAAHCEATTHHHLISNCLAQSQALMQGKSISQAYDELLAGGSSEIEARCLSAHKTVPGNRPSNTLLLEEFTPHCLGALLAFYEHSVYVQSVIWNINAFDQWGVELGKEMSGQIFSLINDPDRNPQNFNQLDSSTQTLLKHLHNKN
jgi:glucose-6-phosphate isomerase